MQAGHVKVVACWSEMDTTFKESCIKGWLCSLHAERRNPKTTLLHQYLATMLQLWPSLETYLFYFFFINLEMVVVGPEWFTVFVVH